MARPRFSRNIIASSDVYKVHSHHRLLQENHKNNEQLFISIANNTTIRHKTSLELFEENLKAKLEQFKREKYERN